MQRDVIGGLKMQLSPVMFPGKHLFQREPRISVAGIDFDDGVVHGAGRGYPVGIPGGPHVQR